MGHRAMQDHAAKRAGKANVACVAGLSRGLLPGVHFGHTAADHGVRHRLNLLLVPSGLRSNLSSRASSCQTKRRSRGSLTLTLSQRGEGTPRGPPLLPLGEGWDEGAAIISQRAEGTARGDHPLSLWEKVGMRAPLGLTPAHESGRECRVGAKHSAPNLGFREETNAECF